jgi:hypothetical protein
MADLRAAGAASEPAQGEPVGFVAEQPRFVA